MTDVRLLSSGAFAAADYPFTPRTLDTPHGQMSYLDEGRGPLLLLVGGTPGWNWEWRHIIQAFKGTHRVVAPDHLGFGLSDKPAGFSYALADHTANLRLLLKHLGVERFSLVAHDFGGPISLPLVLDEPQRLEHLVLMNTWMWPLALDPVFASQRWATQTALMKWMYVRFNFSARFMVKMAWGKHRPLTPEMHAPYLAAFPTSQDRLGTLGFLKATVEEDARLEAMWSRRDAFKGIPTTVVWGMGDNFIGKPHLARWKEFLTGAPVVELPKVGHFPQDEAPELLIPALQAALR